MTIWLGEVRRWSRLRTLPEALPSVLPRVSQSRGSLRALRLLRSPACSFCSRAVDFLAPARLAEAWGQRGARFQEQACETLLDHEGSPWPCPLGRPRVGRWPASPPAAASPLTRKGGGRPLLPVQGARGARACVDGLQAGAHSPEVPDCLAVRTRRTVWGREGSASPGASLKRCPDRSPHGRGAWLRPPRSAWTPRSRGGDAGDSFPPGDSAASSAGPAPQAPHKLGRGRLRPGLFARRAASGGAPGRGPIRGPGRTVWHHGGCCCSNNALR